MPYNKASAQLYYNDFGVWPKGYEPEKLTDRGKALDRIRSGTGDKADSVFIGLQPRSTKIDPYSPKEAFAESTAALGSRTVFGTPAPGDPEKIQSLSRFSRDIMPATVPLRPSQVEADSLANIGLRVLKEETVPSDITKTKAYRGLQEGLKAKTTKPEKDTPDEDFTKLMKEREGLLEDYYNPRTTLDDTTAVKKIYRSIGARLQETERKMDQLTIKQLTKVYPPAKYMGKKIKHNLTGAWYVSNGYRWMPIIEEKITGDE